VFNVPTTPIGPLEQRPDAHPDTREASVMPSRHVTQHTNRLSRGLKSKSRGPERAPRAQKSAPAFHGTVKLGFRGQNWPTFSAIATRPRHAVFNVPTTPIGPLESNRPA
jgi:hypothetical protein